jgi:hypothetical protein
MVDQQFTGCRRRQAGDQAETSALATPAWTDEADKLAVLQRLLLQSLPRFGAELEHTRKLRLQLRVPRRGLSKALMRVAGRARSRIDNAQVGRSSLMVALLLTCAAELDDSARDRHLEARYSFGIRSVLLIMSVPDRTNSRASGCNSHGAIDHAPP